MPRAYRDTVATNFFKRTSGMIAGDGGYSVALADGRSLWLMGDSHIDDYDPATGSIPCIFQVNNSAVLQAANSWKQEDTKTLTSNGPGRKSFFKSSDDDKDFYWPGAGIQVKDTVYVYCSGVKIIGSGVMGFAPTGKHVLAKLKFPEMTVKGYITLNIPDKMGYGSAFIKDGKYIYVYGHKHSFGISDIYVARFPVSNFYARWDYWDGKSWQKDPLKSAVIGSTNGGTPMVTKLKNKIVLVGSELSVDCDQGTKIYAATSTNFTGPFSEKRVIHTIDDRKDGHSPFFYLPAIHSQFSTADKDVLLTYSINGYGKCAEWCINGRANPNDYQLQAVRVPLKLIDPAL
ncbi:hypothetical protein DJ568_09670 [Mucilaginibacter hurinus]|uniref:DUF4185 domain-containing protein n=2 Tax=Mucilaginibacter hurinus TaxID=2201324 RepID=A0A367GNW8_9SPHI|nr:hypothetical protein DJ568_09670 [Mucilaginibacter hurinus]